MPTIKEVEPNIRKIYNPSEDLKEVLKYVYTRYGEMRDERSPHEDTWEKSEKQWDAYRTIKHADDWKSNIIIPLTSSVIEAELSEIINQELKPWAIARGVEDEPKAQVMNAILNYTWDTAKSDVALLEMAKDALIYGTGIGMEYYWQQPRTIKNKAGEEKKVLEFDDCYLEPVRLWDFFVDERARAFSGPFGARDCIRRYVMPYEDFRTFFKGKTWDPLGTAELVKPGGDTNYYEFYKPPSGINSVKEVEVLWYWNKPKDLLAIVANDVLVVSKPNPYQHKQLPFVRVVDIKKPYQFYGKGEAEILESLQDEVNTLRRMIIDRNHLDIDKPILVSDTLTIDDADIMARPHGVIPVGDVNQAKPLEYSDIPRSVFLSLEMLNDDKIRVTGMDERQQSVSTAGTATEAAILKEATLKRLNMKIWNIKNDTLVDLGKMRVANILQYYSQPKLESISGEKIVEQVRAAGKLYKVGKENFKQGYRNIRLQDEAVNINPQTNQPEVIKAKGYTFFEADPKFFLPTHGGYDIRYKATSSMPISKPLEQQKADELYDRLATNPTVDPWKLAEYMLKTRELNPDEFKFKQQGPASAGGAGDLQKMVDIAGVENDEMIRGNDIGPTPYASPAHTEIHIGYMKSKKFQEEVPVDDEATIQRFTNHITGELMAQKVRGGQPAEAQPQGMPGADMGQGMPNGQQMPSGDPTMGNVVPGRIEGGGEVPNGIQGANSGVQVGRAV
jgi:hypothetical protein